VSACHHRRRAPQRIIPKVGLRRPSQSGHPR
jgi:hypothetical protein